MAAAIVEEISEFLQKGRAKNVKKLVEEALEQGVDPKEILNDGLLAGMMIIGGKFKRNEVSEQLRATFMISERTW